MPQCSSLAVRVAAFAFLSLPLVFAVLSLQESGRRAWRAYAAEVTPPAPRFQKEKPLPFAIVRARKEGAGEQKR